MTALAHTQQFTLRHLRELARQPWWIAISLAQPLVYLLLFSAVFRKVADIPGFQGGSYLDFFVPGVVVVTALFSGGWAGMGIINDLDRGILDRFLVSPASRGALIAGRLGQQAIVTVIQSLIVAAVLLGTAFGALSIALALVLRREESVIGAVQLLVLPLTFLSTVWMQRELLPGWIAEIARYNPVDWATTAGREAVAAEVDWGTVLSQGGYLLAFALASAWLATRAFRAYQSSL